MGRRVAVGLSHRWDIPCSHLHQPMVQFLKSPNEANLVSFEHRSVPFGINLVMRLFHPTSTCSAKTTSYIRHAHTWIHRWRRLSCISNRGSGRHIYSFLDGICHKLFVSASDSWLVLEFGSIVFVVDTSSPVWPSPVSSRERDVKGYC